jgi:hypothetical protein
MRKKGPALLPTPSSPRLDPLGNRSRSCLRPAPSGFGGNPCKGRRERRRSRMDLLVTGPAILEIVAQAPTPHPPAAAACSAGRIRRPDPLRVAVAIPAA